MEVFLLLGVIWAAVLVPQWLENRRDARPTASIASFNRQLWSLERTTPTYEDSAYGSTYGVAPLAPGRRRGADVRHAVDASYDGPVAADEADGPGGQIVVFDDLRDDEVLDGSVGPAAPVALAGAPVTPLDAARARARRHTPAGGPVGRARAGGGPDAAPDARPEDRPAQSPAGANARRRAAAVRRRRQIFATLLALAVVTALPAALVGGSWLVVHGVTDGLLFAYVTLLVRRQRRLAERAEKVHYLSPIRAPRPAVVVLRSSTGTER